MKLPTIIMAAGLAIGALTAASPASAQPNGGRHDGYSQRHNGGGRWQDDRGRGKNWRHQKRCRTEWRHGRRVRRCH